MIPIKDNYKFGTDPTMQVLFQAIILPPVGGRIIGFIPFPRVLVLCEMQSVSLRILTRVDVSISYDDNHYTTGNTISVQYLLILFSIYNNRSNERK